MSWGFGEGGHNPANPNDIIAPISSAEYLKTRDDITLRSIVSQGQPNFGMSPFGVTYGGSLEDDEIDAIVVFIRSWEANPPVEQPPEVTVEPSDTVALNGPEIFAQVCAQCHGLLGEGLVAPSLRDREFQSKNTDQQIFDIINLGHEVTAMIGWGDILSAEQIEELVKYIRDLGKQAPVEPTATPAGPLTYVNDVLPIFKARCIACHGILGGWDGSTYQKTMTTGNNAPVVIPGDIKGSIIAQKILGLQTEGKVMPPAGKMSDQEIQIILDWIAAGALEK